MKKILMIVAGFGLLGTVPAFGTVYDYRIDGGNDITDWVLEGYNWVDWSTPSTGENWVRIDYSWASDGAGYGSRRAFTWTAPQNEYITSVVFNFVYNADITNFSPAVYTMGATDSLSGTTSIVWNGQGAGWGSGSNTLSFTEEDNLQKIGMGLDCPLWGYIGYFTEYSNMVITTQSAPEPTTMLLLGIGGMLVTGRRIRKRA